MGLQFGIDFTGGTLMERGFSGTITADAVREVLGSPELADLNLSGAVVQPVDGVREGETVMIIRAGELTNDEIARVDEALAAAFGRAEVRRTEMVGPTIGSELIQRSVWALVIAAVAVSVYVAFRFEYRFGIAALVAQVLDVLVVVAVLALLRSEINTPFVAAILTVVGYSLNDSIVVFDRIRENLAVRKKESLEELVNKSIVQTLPRSINTSLTTLFVLVALYLFGGATIRDFTLTMLVGVVVGTVTSIFVSTSVWLLLRQSGQRAKRPATAQG